MFSQRRRKTDRCYGLAATAMLALACASTGTAGRQSVNTSGLPIARVIVRTGANVQAPDKSVPYTSQEFGFSIDKPAGDAWALATNVTSPEGHQIPVVVAHPESGAQIVVQVSDPVQSPKELATMLRAKLQTEQSMSLTQPERLQINSGNTAYGFNFAVKGEADGRVAIIALDDQIVLVVASWPENADKAVIRQIDGVVKSVRSARNNSERAVLRPDKA